MRMIAATCLVLSACIAAPSADAALQSSVLEWTRWEQVLTSSKTYANPYVEVTVSTTFTGPGGTVIRGYGFWDGGNTFRIRCMFTKAGTWIWTTSCSDTTNADLHNRSGSVNVGAYGGPNPLYQRGYLKISADKRLLIHDDGTPFFWMADTAWVGLRAATRPEWESYIQKRKNQRFNVIQGTSGSGFTNRQTDRNGNAPFTGSGDSLAMNPIYWQGVDQKVQYANDQGLVLYICGVGQSAFHGFPTTDPVHVRRHARNLVARLMGNFVIFGPTADQWWSSAADASGSELQAASSMHLVSTHPEMTPATAPFTYHDKAYIDFAGVQTSMGWLSQPHSQSGDQWGNYRNPWFSGALANRYAVEAPLSLLNRAPLKPVINQEVVYDLKAMHDGAASSHFSAFQQPYPTWLVRSSAYLTILSGSKGVTYGCEGVQNFGVQGTGVFASGWDLNTGLNRPSATHMQYLAQLFSGIAWWRLEPRHDLIRNQPADWLYRTALAKTAAGDLAVAYLPDNSSINVDMSAFPTPMAAKWYHPTSGGTQNISSGIANSGIHSFARPGAGDWALVLTSGTTTPPPPPPGDAYVSDLAPTYVTSGYGPIGKDQSNGEFAAGDGHTITLNGVSYAKGLGVHAYSELRYSLAGQYATFVSDIGVDDETGTRATIVFQVWADGVKLFDSGVMTQTSATKSVNVNVAGKQELRLIVTDAGDGIYNDHADWAGARLLKGTPTTTPPPPPGNLLVNPGFESGLQNWIVYGAMGNPADSGASVVTSPVHSGTRALQIQTSSTAYRNAVQEMPAQAGASFSASAWVSTSNLAGGAEVWLAWYGPGMVSLRWDPIGTLKATSPWTQFSGTRIAPSGVVLVRIVLRTAAEPDGSGTAWFDDASLSASQ